MKSRKIKQIVGVCVPALALLIGYLLFTANWSSNNPRHTDDGSAVSVKRVRSSSYLPSDSKAVTRKATGWISHEEPVNVEPKQDAQSVLLSLVDNPELLENFNFQPVESDFKVNQELLEKYNLGKYSKALQAVLDRTKRQLVQYDQDNLREIKSVGKDSMYFIAGTPNSDIREDFEDKLAGVFNDSRLSKLFLEKIRQNLQAITGDFAEQNRVLVFSSLGPGDEERGYPNMKYIVSSGIINPKITYADAVKIALSNIRPSLREAVPTTHARDTAFEEVPAEFKHLME